MKRSAAPPDRYLQNWDSLICPLFLLLFFAPLLAAHAEPQATHGQRQALLIGNQSYPTAALENPANDARKLGESLQNLGFKPTVMLDKTKAEILAATKSFAAGLHHGDIGIFYYAGHGFQIDSDNFIAPVNFDPSSEAEARAQGIKFSEIKSSLEQTGAALVIMILDSCRNNPFGGKDADRKGLALLEAGLGSYVVFAASPGKTASDSPSGNNGLFAANLLNELGKPVTVAELFRRVRADVFKSSGQKQLPYLHDQMIGDFSLGAPQSNPTDLNETLEEGVRLFQLRQCEQASAIFNRLARQDPQNPYVQNALGLSYVCLQMNSPAVQSFGMAIRLKPDLAVAYLNRGQVYLETAEFELAIEDFTWAIEQEPDNSAFHSRRGEALFGLRRYEDAERDFNDAISLDPSNAYAYHDRGRLFHRLGKYPQALADFNAAIRLKSNDPRFYTDRALSRERSGNAAGAAADRAAANRFKN